MTASSGLVLYPEAESLRERETREASAYHFFHHAALSIPAEITTDTAIPTTGGGYEFELMPDTVIPLNFRALLPQVPFFTVWEGSITMALDAQVRMQFMLKTKHVIGSKSFTSVRPHIVTYRANIEQTMPLVVFNSISFLQEGQSYTFGDDMHSFDRDDFHTAPTINYTLELRALNTGNDGRKAVNITHASFQSIDNISYQLRHMGPI